MFSSARLDEMLKDLSVPGTKDELRVVLLRFGVAPEELTGDEDYAGGRNWEVTGPATRVKRRKANLDADKDQEVLLEMRVAGE